MPSGAVTLGEIELAASSDDFHIGVPSQSISIAAWCRKLAMAIYIATVAWAPFPLGSAVSWGAPVLEILVGIAWLAWAVSAYLDSADVWRSFKKVWIPTVLVAPVLLWIILQMMPIPWVTPHPVWGMASDLLHKHISGSISINPWRTKTELIKLISEIAAFWLALCLASRADTAKILLNAIVIGTSLYALYGVGLAFFNTSQASLVYGVPIPPLYISGPFMLHNSFATFCGLGLLASFLSLFEGGSKYIVSGRGARQLVLSVVQFVFGRGALKLASVVLLFGALLASASRGGFVSTLVALFVIAIMSLIRSRRSHQRSWAVAGAILAISPIVIFLIANANTLSTRLVQFADAGTADAVRLSLWAASERMIGVFPWTGLGLGTFQDAYPMFATQVLPFVLDKAHCDYLELAAGIGLPAAILWWAALTYLFVKCARGCLVRRRNAIFPLLGMGATVLVAAHSLVDFSLQIPAVALIFVTLLAIGVAQSERTEHA